MLVQDGEAGLAEVELGLHLRDGCKVDGVEVLVPLRREGVDQSDAADAGGTNNVNRVEEPKDEKGDEQMGERIGENVVKEEKDGDVVMHEEISAPDATTATVTTGISTTTSTTLGPPPNHSISIHHHDPLSILLTRPASLHSVEEDGAAPRHNSTHNHSHATKRRYEADAHASRGIVGLTNSLRAASIGSAVGELRVRFVPNGVNNPGSTVDTFGDAAATTNADIKAGSTYNASESANNFTDQIKKDLLNCWRNDLSSPIGESTKGSIETKMISNMIEWRCASRKEARVELIAGALAEASLENEKNKHSHGKKKISKAMKIVIKFSLRPEGMLASALLRDGSTGHMGASLAQQQHQDHHHHTPVKHIGGLTLISPPPNMDNSQLPISHRTPHVHTTTGTFGDHQGVRSYLPTLDSASPYHRCSHEFTVMVTALKEEGLWVTGSGEDMGCHRCVSHPILEMDVLEGVKKEYLEDDERYKEGMGRVERVVSKAEECLVRALGERHVRFLRDAHESSSEEEMEPMDVPSSSNAIPDSITSSELNISDSIDRELMNQLRALEPSYVTSIFTSLIWSPCPSRSLGFAVGPFATVYDPEYFRLDADEEDNDEDEAEEGDNSPLSILDTVRKKGEGIRQLYFSPVNDRPWIHSDVTDDLIFGLEFPSLSRRHRQRPKLSPAAIRDNQLIENTVLASTIGVPNRALSLMRDILALPSYRTSSYTQIWIPNAHMSGSNCGGNMVGCPEVGGCNYFLGGAIIDSCLMPPPGMRLPFYQEGRTLQFIQARNAIRGWVRSAISLGNDDDVGQGYLHVLIETFLMSLYERGHGAFGEGGGKGSFFYTKRYAIGCGLNSMNLDFLPLLNIEDDEVVSGGVAIGKR